MKNIITEQDLIRLSDLEKPLQELITELTDGFGIDENLAMLFFNIGFSVCSLYSAKEISDSKVILEH